MNIARLLRIRARILILIVLAVAATTLVALLGSGRAAIAVESAAAARLRASNRSMDAQIEAYLQRMEREIGVTAQNPAVIDAAETLRQIWDATSFPPDVIAEARADQLTYLEDSFASLLPTGAPLPDGAYLPKDERGLVWQARYIAQNDNPTGRKDLLATAGSGDAYDGAHEAIHGYLRALQRSSGYYDVFIADAESGVILYSVFKEIDFMTSLRTGPYATTNFARAFTQAADLRTAGSAVFVDYAPYYPSYQAPAAFVAAPIRSGDETIAVLLFQFPVDEIDRITTVDEAWLEFGYGETGESFLAGADRYLRSNLRGVIESPATFLETLAQSDGAEANVRRITDTGSAILNVALAESTVAAIDESIAAGVDTVAVQGLTGQPTLFAWSDVTSGGFDWRLYSGQDLEEVRAPVVQLERAFVVTLIVTLVVLLLVSGAIARSISAPLRLASEALAGIAEGEADLTARLPDAGSDEVSDLARHYNSFVTRLRGTVADVQGAVRDGLRLGESLDESVDQSSNSSGVVERAAGDVATQVATLHEVVQQTSDAISAISREIGRLESAVEDQGRAVDDSSSATEEIASTIDSVARIAHAREEAARSLVGLTASGAEQITATITALRGLTAATDRILEVSTTIDAISEQTGLLAMNAAIEAAHAGEAGRGFSVVAEQIRKLSEDASEQAQAIATELKAAVDEIAGASRTGEAAAKTFEGIRSHAEQTIQGLREISHSVREVASGSSQMVDATLTVRDQTATVRSVSDGIASRNREMQTAVSRVESVTGVIEDRLTHMAEETENIVAKMTRVRSLSEENRTRLSTIAAQMQQFTT